MVETGLERLRRISQKVTTDELVERGFAALEATGLNGDEIERIARSVGLDGEDMALSVASALPTRTSSRNSSHLGDGAIRAQLAAMDGKLDEIRHSLVEQRANQLEKEWYTIAEAADATGFTPYTLRQRCNLGVIPEKWREKHYRTGVWRIRREAIDHIRNHGLPPVT